MISPKRGVIRITKTFRVAEGSRKLRGGHMIAASRGAMAVGSLKVARFILGVTGLLVSSSAGKGGKKLSDGSLSRANQVGI